MCGAKLHIGSYPFCKGNPQDHETVRSRAAAAFKPTVVFVNSKGEYRFPPSSNSRPPAGFQRKELTTLREADSFIREVNMRERLKAEENAYNEKRFWSKVHSGNAEQLKERAKGFQTEEIRRYAERAIEKLRNYQGPRVADPNFYIEPIAYDSSNRESYCNQETGWRERKD